MATRCGAKALGLDAEVGSLELGKRADVIVVDTSGPHLVPAVDVYSTLVYGARGSDVRTTVVGGEVLLDDFRVKRVDLLGLPATAEAEARALAKRAGL